MNASAISVYTKRSCNFEIILLLIYYTTENIVSALAP